MDALGICLYAAEFGKPVFARRDETSTLLKAAAMQADGLKANAAFLLPEWEDVVDTWQVESWEAYRDAKRLGRKARLWIHLSLVQAIDGLSQSVAVGIARAARPQAVGAIGVERRPAHQGARTESGRLWHGRVCALASVHAFDAQAAHQPRTAGNGLALAMHLTPDLTRTVDLEVPVPDATDIDHPLLFLLRSVAAQRRIAAPGGMTPVG